MATPHSTDNYTLSRGILSIATWSGGSPGAYEDMGNCNTIDLEPKVEKLAHYTKRSETKNKDKTTVLETGYDLTFDLDEIASTNLSKFLMGSISGDLIYGMQSISTEYALKFIDDNPEGPNKAWYFHKGTLAPNGSLTLLGDEWLNMSYRFEGLTDVANNAVSPHFTISYSTSVSSSSSSSTTA